MARVWVITVAAVALTSCTSIDPATPRPAATTSVTPPRPSVVAPTSTLVTTTTTSPPVPERTDALRLGAQGPSVQQLQERLAALRYWNGSVDGDFGVLTEQAVYAFQSINNLTPDGVVGEATRRALAAPAEPAPVSTEGVVWEVDKTRQVLMVVRDGSPIWIWHVSTGSDTPYTHDGRRLQADTPNGQFRFAWQVDKWRDGELGPLYRPKYFHRDGIAVHGYGRVPPVPASHGCVRVTLEAMDFIWSSGLAPLGAAIWVYGDSQDVAHS